MRQRRLRAFVDEGVRVGSITLSQPVMTASGTAGHADELSPYMNIEELGAVVVKSLYHSPWPGNAAPRVHPVAAGMINAVGLQGPGVEEWIAKDLPLLEARGARVVASIWGRGIDDYRRAAQMIAKVAHRITALEVNLSCPNLEGRGGIIAHDAQVSAAVVEACAVAGLPMWAKLSPNTDRIVEIAGSVLDAGADALTLTNTLLGMAIDVESARPVLGNGGGGISGRTMHAVAVRAVHDVRAALPQCAIVGVGGIASGVDAIEMMQAGANAVQVGTATFLRPDAPMVVLNEAHAWMHRRGERSWADVTSRAHR